MFSVPEASERELLGADPPLTFGLTPRAKLWRIFIAAMLVLAASAKISSATMVSILKQKKRKRPSDMCTYTVKIIMYWQSRINSTE